MWKLEEPFHIFALYAVLNALIMLILGLLVTRARVVTHTDIGDGGKPEMAGPLRAHANNTEWVPMAMILMWLFCPLGAPWWLLHVMGVPLTLGRILHAVGMSQSTGPTPMRSAGMILTWLAYIIGIAGVIYLAFIATVDLAAITS